MKINFKLFAVATLAALSLAACKKEQPAVLTASPSSMTIAAENAPAAKITLESNVNWVAENTASWLKLDVTSGNGNAVISLTAENNTSKTSRKATITISGVNVNIIPVTVEITQQGVDHSILTISPATLEFAYDAASDQKLTVVNNDAWVLSSTLPDWISVDPLFGSGDGQISVVTTTNKKSVAREFVLEFVGEDGYTKSSVTVKQAAAPIDPKVPQGSGTEADPYTIANADQWMTIINDWKDTQGATFAREAHYKAIADIDFNGVALFTPDSLRGSFDGGNHKFYNIVISGNNSNVGFFNVVTGPFKNIIFGSKDGKNYDGVSKLTYTGTSGWHYVAPVARLAANAENVVNFMNVEIAADSQGKVRGACMFGHIVGTDLTVKNCTNYGNFTALNSGKTTVNECLFGGIVATFEDLGVGHLENCDNYGTIKSADPYTTALGGVAGNSPSSKIFELKDCDNYGLVDINTTTTPANYKEGYVGGVAGYLNGSSKTGIILDNCINHANLTVTGISVGNFGGIAGRVPSGEYKNCVNEGNLTFDGSAADGVGKALLMGGIAGGHYTGGSIHDCTNKGNIISNKNQVNRTGGIVGTVNSGDITVEKCTNTGSVKVVRASENINWQSVGGIVGFQEKNANFYLKSCNNSGVVVIDVNNTTTHANHLSAGGIVGLTCKGGVLTGNTNTGAVSIKNTGKSIARAGGVAGWVATNAASASGNSSKADVTVNATVDSFTGGAYGRVDVATFAISNDSANGNVSSTSDLTMTGSFVGYNTAAITGASVAGTVNGAAASAANAQGSSSTGSVTLK